LAVGESGDQSQAPGIEHEAFLHRLRAGDGDLARQVCPPEGDVDDVLAGLEPQRRRRLAAQGGGIELAVGPGPFVEDAPRETLLDALAVLGEPRHERYLAGAGV